MTRQHSLRRQASARADQGSRAPTALLDLIVGAWSAQAVSVAARLGIADLLAKGPRSSAELAAATQSHPQALHRLLRALASFGVFAEIGSGRFALTPLAEQLRSDATASLRGYAMLLGQDWHWQACGNLLHSVRTGESAIEHATGLSVFDYLARHPEAASAFDAAMNSRSSFEDEAIAAAYDFPGGTIVDIGGGRGSLLARILERTPDADGVLFDLAHVLAGAAAVVRAAEVARRCRLLAGDFFESVPPGDLYVMKKIIHDWDDERARRILANCRAAIKSDGRLLILEQVILPGNGQAIGKIFDLQMLAQTPGGRERTEAEYRALLADAGFELARIIPSACPLDIVEARPC